MVRLGFNVTSRTNVYYMNVQVIDQGARLLALMPATGIMATSEHGGLASTRYGDPGVAASVSRKLLHQPRARAAALAKGGAGRWDGEGRESVHWERGNIPRDRAPGDPTTHPTRATADTSGGGIFVSTSSNGIDWSRPRLVFRSHAVGPRIEDHPIGYLQDEGSHEGSLYVMGRISFADAASAEKGKNWTSAAHGAAQGAAHGVRPEAVLRGAGHAAGREVSSSPARPRASPMGSLRVARIRISLRDLLDERIPAETGAQGRVARTQPLLPPLHFSAVGGRGVRRGWLTVDMDAAVLPFTCRPSPDAKRPQARAMVSTGSWLPERILPTCRAPHFARICADLSVASVCSGHQRML